MRYRQLRGRVVPARQERPSLEASPESTNHHRLPLAAPPTHGLSTGQQHHRRPLTVTAGLSTGQHHHRRPLTETAGLYTGQQHHSRPLTETPGLYTGQQHHPWPLTETAGLSTGQHHHRRPLTETAGLLSAGCEQHHSLLSGGSGRDSRVTSHSKAITSWLCVNLRGYYYHSLHFAVV